jgi:hypothetical protein
LSLDDRETPVPNPSQIAEARPRVAGPSSSQRQAYALAIFGVVLTAVLLVLYGLQLYLRVNAAVSNALENMDQGVFVRSADGTLPIYNRRALELTGLPAEFTAATPTTEESIDYQRRHGEFDNLAPETLAEMKGKAESGLPGNTVAASTHLCRCRGRGRLSR